MSQIAIYAGWYDGDVSGPFRLPKVEFMPGAFAYHLHSFSADTIRSSDTHWCGPLLAKGATCTMGCVYEPYLQFTPNIAFFLQSLGNGYTFGEAAWASQLGLSWQTTVIGDPLVSAIPCKTAGGTPRPTGAYGKVRYIEWSFEKLVNLDIARGVRLPQLEQFLQNLPPPRPRAPSSPRSWRTSTESLGKPSSSAIDAWQNALKLNPSPQQRIRIRRTLGEKLLALGRRADAIDNYKNCSPSARLSGKPEIEAATD